MNKFVIGCDPDSKAHGIAIYEYGKLTELHNLQLIELYTLIKNLKQFGKVIVSIEDNNAISAIYAGRFGNKDSQAVKSKKAQHVGMCKQAQIEVERACKELGVEAIQWKPSKLWKDQDGKKQFEAVTGWKGRSNEDTRSASYFGWLLTQKSDKSRLIKSVMQ